LPIEAVSQASADQRKGRCGRVAPGVCIRLYSEEDYAGRSRYTTPEIRRTNLASVILQAKALRLGPIEEFPLLDPPGTESLRDGYRTLFEIGAIDGRRHLTALGKQLSQLPVDPRIGRIILAAGDEDCLAEILIIASALEIQDPRERPIDRQQQADEAHAQWKDEQSDFLSLLKLWDFYHHLKQSLSRNQLRRACQQNFLSLNRMREWTEIERQLLDLTGRTGLKPTTRRDDSAAIHRALLAGFLSGLAYRSGDHTYTGAGGLQLRLWPGSGLFKNKPKWIVAAELVETTQRYARTVGQINPNWVEPIADHLVKRSYSDPHWHEKSGAVMAFERVTLFGLPLVARRRVPYGPIDPQVSRELFLQHGLVERQLNISDSFFVHNAEVLDQVKGLAAKTRSREYLVDDYAVYRFYDQRLPADVYDLSGLRKWLRGARNAPDERLHMSVSDFIEVDTAQGAAESFPESLSWGSLELPVSYHFEPGSEQDGVTVTVPVEAAGQLAEGNAGWLVPGLLEEKITALIRSLPKPIRRKLIPAPDTAKAVASQLTFAAGPFLDRLTEKLSQVAGESIPRDAYRLDKLPPHLRLNFEVIGADGKIEAQGRDVTQILEQLDVQSDAPTDHVSSQQWDRDDVTTWDFGTLPPEVVIGRGGIDVPAYPSVIDCGDRVQIRLLSSAEKSSRVSRQGIMRLYSIAERRAVRNQVRWLPRWDEICLLASGVIEQRELKQQVQDLIAMRAFLGDEPSPRDQDQFQGRLKDATERIAVATQDVAQLLPRLFETCHQARLAWEQASSDRLVYARDDVATQLHCLLEPGFLIRTDWRWLTQYPRFLQAIDHRLDKLRGGPHAQDKAATAELARFWAQYARQRDDNERLGRYDAQLEHFRWMLEEYRVSLFAQQLGTSAPVSAKRLEKQWSKVTGT
jgi:ATP-dependent helicase HrpA